jgi:hypothetical protein
MITYSQAVSLYKTYCSCYFITICKQFCFFLAEVNEIDSYHQGKCVGISALYYAYCRGWLPYFLLI